MLIRQRQAHQKTKSKWNAMLLLRVRKPMPRHRNGNLFLSQPHFHQEAFNLSPATKCAPWILVTVKVVLLFNPACTPST